MLYSEIVELRRAFLLPGYSSLTDIGMDGDWVTPYQITSRHPTGPCLVAYNWLDVPSIEENKATLERHGYLPGILFNRVLDRALAMAGLDRTRVYITQAFHLLPRTRSQAIPQRDVLQSFEAITQHELAERRVVALGGAASRACSTLGIRHLATPHPSARGLTIEAKAESIAKALIQAREALQA